MKWVRTSYAHASEVVCRTLQRRYPYDTLEVFHLDSCIGTETSSNVPIAELSGVLARWNNEFPQCLARIALDDSNGVAAQIVCECEPGGQSDCTHRDATSGTCIRPQLMLRLVTREGRSVLLGNVFKAPDYRGPIDRP
jgi:hypothetical protein